MKRAHLRALVVALGISSVVACRPKGSDKTPAMERTSVGNYVIRHPNFEGHLDPKAKHEGASWPLRFEYSSMPEKSAIVVGGKTIPLSRSGEVPTSIDLGGMIGDAPIGVLTSSQRIPVNVPFELSFWSDRQKVSAVMTDVNVWLELRECIRNPPCPFTSDGPVNAKPNIVFFEKSDSIGQKLIGSPARIRDIDWIASSSPAADIDGKTCKMQRIQPGSPTNNMTDEHTLKRESETITIYDRRSGTKLQTRELVGPDRCPLIADVKLSGPKAGLRSAVEPSDRDLLFKELRGEGPAAPSSTAQTPSQKPKKPGK